MRLKYVLPTDQEWYAVCYPALSGDMGFLGGGSLTFSFIERIWEECIFPWDYVWEGFFVERREEEDEDECGALVVVSNVVLWPGGWRAHSARFFSFGDKPLLEPVVPVMSRQKET
tara:strand:- start:402 stop:746 length:345 start_codon:yes stop_codon:yes gene_type:complete